MLYAHPPVSTDARILLRPMAVADAAAWSACLSGPGTLALTSWGATDADTLARSIAANAEPTPHSQARFAVIWRETGELIGSAGFHTVLPENATAEIAYDFAPHMWGRGIATAVVADLLRWVFAEFGAVRIQGAVYEKNAASLRVLEKTGFVREALLHKFRKVGGTPADFFIYACFAPPA